MKRTTLLIALLLALAPGALAQQTPPAGGPPAGQRPGAAGAMQGFTLTGRVMDDEHNQPIPSATVAVWRAADSTLATGAVTEDDGRFSIEGLRPGRYYVRVSFLGFASQTINDVRPEGPPFRKDLGTIRLVPDTKQLAEVQVTGERTFMQVAVDRNIFNVKDQLVAVGGNGLDVLRNIPSVEVDIDNNISLRGNQNLAVLINGRPSPMQGTALVAFLQGLPSSSIDRVEVIPNPSAKYEPDGMAGILNIVLREDTGPHTSATVTTSADSRQNYGASANLNIQKGKLGLNLGYGFRDGGRDMSGWRFQEYRQLTPVTSLNTSDDEQHDNTRHTFNGNLDYQLSKLSTVTLAAMINAGVGHENGVTLYNPLGGGIFESATDRTALGRDVDRGMDYRLTYRRTVEMSKNELKAELRYERDAERERNDYRQSALSAESISTLTEQQQSINDGHDSGLSLQIDYERPLSEKVHLEAGYKGSLNKISSDYFSQSLNLATGLWDVDYDINDTFDYEQTIHAGYGILGLTLGRFGVQAGVRAENAVRSFTLAKAPDTEYRKSYLNFFPSVFVTYDLKHGRSARLSYSKRINRPRTHGFFNQLNPISDQDDPLFRRIGNPNLDPEYVHSFELTLSQLSNAASLTLTPYFRRATNIIRFVDRVDAQGVTTITFENLNSSDSYGGEIIGTLRLGQKANAFANVNVYRVVTDASNVDASYNNNAWGLNTRLNGTFSLPGSRDMQLTWFYSPPQKIEGGRRAAMQFLELALRQKFLDDRASLALKVSDPFQTMGMHMRRDLPQLYMEMDRGFDSRRIGLTFTYNFGQQPKNNRRNRPQEQQQGGEDNGGLDMGM